MIEERMAIMKDVGFGLRDVGQPCLWFTTYIDEHMAALQVLRGKEIEKILVDSNSYDVKELEGKPCWVQIDGNIIKFLRFLKV